MNDITPEAVAIRVEALRRASSRFDLLDCEAALQVADLAEAIATRVAELEAAMRELVDHTHNCEKELTEKLHHAEFCGESLPLTKARATLAAWEDVT